MYMFASHDPRSYTRWGTREAHPVGEDPYPCVARSMYIMCIYIYIYIYMHTYTHTYTHTFGLLVDCVVDYLDLVYYCCVFARSSDTARGCRKRLWTTNGEPIAGKDCSHARGSKWHGAAWYSIV